VADLYANENFPLPAVEYLRELGHNVLTSQESGRANQRVSDDQVLSFATSQNRAVVTLNRRDFIKLHHNIKPHAGIVVCTQDSDFQSLADRIDREIRNHNSLFNQLIRITRG
jgi:predicted nuclease of predicted toxin-antitoxin system